MNQSIWILKRSSSSPRAQAIRSLLIFALFILFSAILSGCASKGMIRDVPLSYNAIKTVVAKNMPQGVKRESTNGRELTSNYFLVDSFAPEKGEIDERAYAVVTILGSSRPYNVDVKVLREVKQNGFFKAGGTEKDMSRRLGERLKQALADRREDRNVIDDFRAF